MNCLLLTGKKQTIYDVPLETVVDSSFLGKYEGEPISNQPIPFPIDRDGQNSHALFQCMFYTWV